MAKNDKKIKYLMDGNQAASHIAYKFSELCAIFPISPSSSISEEMEQKSANGEKNIWGNNVRINQMQSEAGAIGAVHGIIQNGVASSTFTSSQGLLLMVPNIYRIRGTLLPVVIYVASRAIASRTLSIFGDHQDIYAVRQTGIAIMSCHSVQQVMDLSPVAHAIAMTASTPIINFFDGYRTSHETQSITKYDDADLKHFLDKKAYDVFKLRSLNSSAPISIGGSEDESTYFQSLEAQNIHNRNIYDIAAKYMAVASKLTGKKYAPFVYYGDPNATRVIIAMGSVTEALELVVDAMNTKKEKVGILKVYLYRPFNANALVDALPKTVTKIAVLDRTKEFGATGEPLYLDVLSSFAQANKFKKMPFIIGGRYGLSSKNVTPQDLAGVFNYLKSANAKHDFTIGINDDLTNLSIPSDSNFKVNTDYVSYLFLGLAGDGLVSVSKNITKIFATYTDNYIQGFVNYDSRKAGGPTKNFLTLSPTPIRATYYSDQSKFITCSKFNFLLTMPNIMDSIGHNGTFLLNSTFSPEEVIKMMPNRIKMILAEKNVKFYIINADEVAYRIGLGSRVNTILQTAFFFLNQQILEFSKAKEIMKDLAKKTYGKKGDAIVELNYKAIDAVSPENIVEIPVDSAWKNIKLQNNKASLKRYNEDFVQTMESTAGSTIPVSFFAQKFGSENILDGKMLNDVTFPMKRQTANFVPKWIPENCIQCSQCAFYCPHATIRAFQFSDEEIKNMPMPKETLEQVNPNNKKYRFAIHIDAENCVGCGLCAAICPGKGPDKKALQMVPAKEVAFKYRELTDYIYKKVDYKIDGYDVNTLKGAAFLYPYMEVSGACAGCGETPYYKLVTQLFGSNMVIANATGCTSIYCGTYPYTPFATDKEGNGPAWANSLFENNAEFGFGMIVASKYKRKIIMDTLKAHLDDLSATDKKIVSKYLKASSRDEEKAIKPDLIKCLMESKSSAMRDLLLYEGVFVKPSHWIIGGDGWSYDIGYGGLDHILATNEDINVLILDTEVYSNTGGQSSKATNTSAVAKFAAEGKQAPKKNIGKIFMSYGHIYVAQVCLGMNAAKTITAMKEAEAYKGPSIVICYCPCIEHGIKGGMSQHRNHEMYAVMSGYWPIYRFNPELKEAGQNPLTIDYKNPNFDNLKSFLLKESRFSSLWVSHPERSQMLFDQLRAEKESSFKDLLKQAS